MRRRNQIVAQTAKNKERESVTATFDSRFFAFVGSQADDTESFAERSIFMYSTAVAGDRCTRTSGPRRWCYLVVHWDIYWTCAESAANSRHHGNHSQSATKFVWPNAPSDAFGGEKIEFIVWPFIFIFSVDETKIERRKIVAHFSFGVYLVRT